MPHLGGFEHCSICHYEFSIDQRVYLGHKQDLVHTELLETIEAQDIVIAFGLYILTFDGTSFFQAGFNKEFIPEWKKACDANRPVFPICRGCFNVLREFLRFRRLVRPWDGRTVIADLPDLYKAFHEQWQRNLTASNGEIKGLEWDHGAYQCGMRHYYFARRGIRIVQQQDETAELSTLVPWQWLKADPWGPIPSLPSYIISQLEETAENDDSKLRPTFNPALQQSPEACPIMRLPIEIMNDVADNLDANSVFALRSSCLKFANAIVLDQQFWYRQLMNRTLLGFFFDFESMNTIKETHYKSQKQKKLPPKWDWRKLVGTMAKHSSFQNDGVMNGAPNAFRNRRRVWKILEMTEKTQQEGTQENQRVNKAERIAGSADDSPSSMAITQ